MNYWQERRYFFPQTLFIIRHSSFASGSPLTFVLNVCFTFCRIVVSVLMMQGNSVPISDGWRIYTMPLNVNIPDEATARIKTIASHLGVPVGRLLSDWIRKGMLDAEAEVRKKMAAEEEREREGAVILGLPLA